MKEKRDRHLAEGSVQPEPTAQQKRTLKRKQRHEESSEASGPTVAADVSFGSSDDGSTPGEAPMTFRSVRIGDEKAVQHYFNDACEAMQQLATKWILKQWIKAVEPNKQSTFPYSENSKRSVKQKGSDGAPVDNAKPRFRPSWWPPEEQMRHKEPDHLKKNGMLPLVLLRKDLTMDAKLVQNACFSFGHLSTLATPRKLFKISMTMRTTRTHGLSCSKHPPKIARICGPQRKRLTGTLKKTVRSGSAVIRS